MQLGIVLSVGALVGAAGMLVRKQVRILHVEWRVRRGLRSALSQVA